MPETVAVQGENLTVDLILWRRYGRQGQEMVEETLNLNPGLAGLGPILPLLTKVVLPDPPPRTQARTRPVVSLFKRTS